MQFNIFYETIYEIQFEKSYTFHICNPISKMLMLVKFIAIQFIIFCLRKMLHLLIILYL